MQSAGERAYQPKLRPPRRQGNLGYHGNRGRGVSTDSLPELWVPAGCQPPSKALAGKTG